MAKTALTAPDGIVTDGVTLWAKSWPQVASESLKADDYVEGDLKEEQKGEYLNKTLYAPRVATKSYSAPRETKSQQVAVAQERKAEYIQEAQSRKDESIAYFNSCNLALQVIGKRSEYENDFQYQRQFELWRDYFVSEWAKSAAKKNLPF